MKFIGYDVGSSSIKASIVDDQGKLIAHAKYPEHEMLIDSPKAGWAEQNPDEWWQNLRILTQKIIAESKIHKNEIKGIGISYQMHGLVLIGKDKQVLCPSMIWCDSRSVKIGDRIFNEIGEEKCMKELLNSPGNFTASKLKWVQENTPEIYDKIWKFMLPGDFIAFKLSGEATTSVTGLSEGILWDFEKHEVSKTMLQHLGIEESFVSDIVENFTEQCCVSKQGAEESGLPEGIPVYYRAGDQPNNAFSLNVMNLGEIAATGGTSGVVYGVTNHIKSKESVRINNFAHINHTKEEPRIGKMLCLNGAGIQYSWLRHQVDQKRHSYHEINDLASKIPIGSDGVIVLPFGNGAERVLHNKDIGSSVFNLNFNRHKSEHLFRAGLEGIAYSFVYGTDILMSDGLQKGIIKAGGDNLFRSSLFTQTITTILDTEIRIIDSTGSTGAARAAAIGAGAFESQNEILTDKDILKSYYPDTKNYDQYKDSYEKWKLKLLQNLNN
ncbi:carbohydrate kinase (plasmid) [Chryseobacterium panacisoli]|uniref:Carbohydrate kinase n=1 Tax=Chryseobacterium panacisoli TaxID=1807141 RepID=A0A5D8ZW32_9FLAO|nr:FGGY family carbohydrate kinase [Chryseobacterium panacisoli]TZF99165.1 carbohydrate kinase [Chryseobacterium panacisoli]